MTDEMPAAVKAFWEAFDAAWQAGGARSADDACHRLQMKSNYTLAPATVRDWRKHKRLPRRDDDVRELFLLLVGQPGTDQLMGLLRAARESRNDVPPPPPLPPPPETTTPLVQRQVWGRVRAWHLGVAAALVAVTAIAVAIVVNDQSPASDTTPTSNVPSEAAAEAAPPCPSDVVTAVSKKERARAEFCPDHREFLLYDEKSDKKSAILVVRRNGQELTPWFNSDGHAKRSSDDSTVVPLPPKPIPISVGPEDTAEFRVCFGDRNQERTYPPETCGDWTPFWPRG